MSLSTSIAGLAAAGFLGGLVRGSTGFGGALVLAPCCALLMQPRDAAELVILVHVFTCLQGFRRYIPTVNWRSVVPLALIAVAFTAVFAKLLDGVNATVNTRIIGCGIFVLSVFQLTGWRWRHRGGVFSIFFTGLCSGAFTAIAGAGGPPAVLYFTGEAREAHRLRANLLGYFVLLYVLSAVVLALEGRASHQGFLMSFAVAPLFYIGSVCGEKVYHRLTGVLFERLVAAVLAVSGLMLAIRG